MRISVLLAAVLPLTSMAQTPTPDPLSVTLPSGKVLHFETYEQKARFEASTERVKAAAAASATPTVVEPFVPSAMTLQTGTLKSGPLQPAKPSRQPNSSPTSEVDKVQPAYEQDGQVKRIARMSVKQVLTSPFSLQGKLVELSDIEKIDIKEIEAGKYRVKVWAKDHSGSLTAYLPQKTAEAAQASSTLYAYVKNPSEDDTEIVIQGNATTYEGTSSVPKVYWH